MVIFVLQVEKQWKLLMNEIAHVVFRYSIFCRKKGFVGEQSRDFYSFDTCLATFNSIYLRFSHMMQWFGCGEL